MARLTTVEQVVERLSGPAFAELHNAASDPWHSAVATPDTKRIKQKG